MPHMSKTALGVLLVLGGVGFGAWTLLRLLWGGVETGEPTLAAFGVLAALLGAAIGGRLLHDAWQARAA